MADSNRLKLLKELQSAARDYVEAETSRLQSEADVLKKILNGRTAGKGVQGIPLAAASRLAYASLEKFLKGKKLSFGD